MATLYKDSNNPNWFARFKNAEGKRISRSTRTTSKRRAREIANDLEGAERKKREKGSAIQTKYAEIIRAAARDAEAGELTLKRADHFVKQLHRLANPSFQIVSVKEHLSNWIESFSGKVGDSTISAYQDMRRRFTAALGKSISAKPIGELTKSEVEKAHKKIIKTKIKNTSRTIKAATANADLSALRRALKVAVEDGLAKSNVAEGIKLIPENDSTEKAPFTTEEVRRLIDHPSTSDQWAGVILIAAHTGLRLSDVVRLNRNHIEGTKLVIRPKKTAQTKKNVEIPLSPPCLKWIGDRQGDFFPDMRRAKTATLSTQFVRIMKRAEVPRDIVCAGEVVKRRSFHSLRHTFTSWLADADVHADVRQKLTGHSSAGVHARYTHHDEALDRAIMMLPDL